MKNWVKYKLNEVCNIGDGNHSSNYPKSDEMVSEGIPFIRANNMVNGEVVWNDMKFITLSKHKILKKGHLKAGDILFTNRGEIGKIAIVGYDFENANLNSQIAWFRCLEKINNRFLFYFLASPSMKTYYSVEKNGAALQQFTIRQINEIEIPLPPLPEQQRIVSILDEAFSAIAKAKANAEQNLRNAKELFESYLQGVFEKKGDGWEECNLEKYIKLIDYRGRTPVKTESGVRLITAKNVKLGYLQLEPQEFIATDNYDSWMTRGIPNFGDVIFTTEAPLANVAQVDTNEKLAFAQRIIVMQPKAEKLDQTFLKYMLLSNPIRKKILDNGTGATVLGIKSSLLKKIEIPIPPLNSQQIIVEKLDALSIETKKLEAIYRQKINDQEEFKNSILQKAFSGELSRGEFVELTNGSAVEKIK